jgi:multiple sugar transport system permease protein
VQANPLGLIPQQVTFEAYRAMAAVDLPRWAFNSAVVTTFVTLGRLFLDSLAGYALARLKFPGRAAVFALVVGVLAVPGIVLAIPRFIVLGQLGLLNSYAGLILPLAVDAFGIFLMKQFFESIPKEMEEAARMDGATIFQTFWRIILPLAAPGLIALTILSFQGSWNEFLHPLIAAPSDPSLRTLPVGLALLRGAGGEQLDFPLLMAGSLLTTIPVAIIFFTFQRYFISGVAASGVKG